ncbi:MAG: hypothetical protein ACTSPA_04520 [Promethearchaeota archaeon]
MTLKEKEMLKEHGFLRKEVPESYYSKIPKLIYTLQKIVAMRLLALQLSI